MSKLPVYFEARLVGTIDVAADGPGFTYDAKWIATPGAFAVSTSMPLSVGRIEPDRFVPWAANLLPESEHLRAVGRYLGTSTGDVIGILGEIGRDTAGALSIGRPGTVSSGRWDPVPDQAALERIIAELPAKPFLIGESGVSMSLAGAQTKLGVSLDATGRICIPTGGAPSTHILKPNTERLWGSVQNEAFCLVLASKVGIPTSEVTTGNARTRTYLLVRRYDRVEASPGRWRRLHQEDFCQALGKPPSAKYESNQTGKRGPTLSDMMRVTCQTASNIGSSALSVLRVCCPIKLCRSQFTRHGGRADVGDRIRLCRTCCA